MKSWIKDAKVRLIMTIVCGILAIIAAGLIFDWRAAIGVLAVEIIACLAYSLKKLFDKKKKRKK